jgi:hypothetical protein
MTLRMVAASSGAFHQFQFGMQSRLPVVSLLAQRRFLNAGTTTIAPVPRQKYLDQANLYRNTFANSCRRKNFLPFNIIKRQLGFSATLPRMEKLVVKVPTMGDSITEVRFRSV